MEITQTLRARSRAEWRAWLEANYETATEIWLINPRKDSGLERVRYNDAVEEALCFGWIDGIVKSYDESSSAQRYTPRRQGSTYSQLNKERLSRQIAAGKVIPSVLEVAKDVLAEEFIVPDDIAAALKAESGAWEFFSATSPSYQRIRAAYVDDARERADVFGKRLRNLVEKSARGKQFGYGIEEYF